MRCSSDEAGWLIWTSTPNDNRDRLSLRIGGAPIGEARGEERWGSVIPLVKEPSEPGGIVAADRLLVVGRSRAGVRELQGVARIHEREQHLAGAAEFRAFRGGRECTLRAADGSSDDVLQRPLRTEARAAIPPQLCGQPRELRADQFGREAVRAAILRAVVVSAGVGGQPHGMLVGGALDEDRQAASFAREIEREVRVGQERLPREGLALIVRDVWPVEAELGEIAPESDTTVPCHDLAFPLDGEDIHPRHQRFVSEATWRPCVMTSRLRPLAKGLGSNVSRTSSDPALEVGFVCVLFGVVDTGSIGQGAATAFESVWEPSLGIYLTIEG